MSPVINSRRGKPVIDGKHNHHHNSPGCNLLKSAPVQYHDPQESANHSENSPRSSCRHCIIAGAKHHPVVILSPGPGRPEDAGICIPVIKEFAGKIPILGVCLGHQSICEAFGGTVSYAKELMHGKKKLMYKTGESQLFKGLPDTFAAARYHSLAALKDTLPAELKVTAESEDGEVMAVEHTKYPVFGVQFHPESVMTPDGRVMIENFMEVVRND